MEEEIFDQRTDLKQLNSAVNKIREALANIVVGQGEVIDLLIAALLANGHVLLEGVPGVAKTLSAKLLAKCVEADFSRVQFTPDLMPSDVIGTAVFNPKSVDFEFKKGPVFGQIVLIDEINRAPAKTQSALFEVMEERQVTVDGTSYQLEEPFMVLATQNPVEHEGTYRLPEAQLDRFLFKIKIDYPSLKDEVEILTRQHQQNNHEQLAAVSPVVKAAEIVALRKTIKALLIEPKILEYIAQIVCETRHNKSLYLGASPRASLAIADGAKAIAAMAGRDFVTPEDVITVAVPVLAHRVILSPEKEMEGLTPADIIKQLIKKIEVPR